MSSRVQGVAPISPRVTVIGKEQQPLVLVDDFWPEPTQLLQYALQQGAVNPATGLYPGLRSPAPPIFGQRVLAQLAPHIQHVFGLTAARIQRVDSYYAMVATPVAQLSAWQCMPHFDRPKPDDLAIVYYLCHAQQGGTSFYRHRRSGFEAITPERQAAYQRSLSDDFQQYGTPKGYINGDNAMFARIAQVPARFNRLLLYRCSSLHSGDIATDYPFDLDPRSGRFTITAFITARD